MKHRRGWWFVSLLLAYSLTPLLPHSLTAFGGRPVVWAQENEPKRTEPKQDSEALKKLDKKLDRMLASLEALQKQLDAMKDELQIVKVRCTR